MFSYFITIVAVMTGLFNVIGIWVCYAIAIADK